MCGCTGEWEWVWQHVSALELGRVDVADTATKCELVMEKIM